MDNFDNMKNSKRSMEKTTNNNNNYDITNHILKSSDNFSTLQSMSEIKKCVEKISSLQKVLKDSSSNSRSSFDQVDRSFITPTKFVSPVIRTKELNIPRKSTEQITDGNYFLKILKSEQTRLLERADDVEVDISILSQEEKPCEDVLGLLRAASGKARLLVSQKMKQFEDLCYKNINHVPSGEFKTTNEDLQGFWDMVKLQINHVDSLFEEIEKLKNNNWILDDSFSENKNITSSKIKKPTNSAQMSKKSSTTKNSQEMNGAQKQAQEARRKELMELKRKAKNAMQNKESSNDPNKLEFFF